MSFHSSTAVCDAGCEGGFGARTACPSGESNLPRMDGYLTWRPAARTAEAMLINPPAGESQANGKVERYIQTHARARAGFESHVDEILKVSFDLKSLAMAWLVQ